MDLYLFVQSLFCPPGGCILNSKKIIRLYMHNIKQYSLVHVDLQAEYLQLRPPQTCDSRVRQWTHEPEVLILTGCTYRAAVCAFNPCHVSFDVIRTSCINVHSKVGSYR